MKRLRIPLTLIVLLLIASSAMAMSSANYRLDWFTPLTTGGGGSASSPAYAVSYSIGQTASSASSSANYRVGLGFWAGGAQFWIHLPIVLRQ